MSGITVIPRSSNTSSAAGSVGPLAPSMISFARTSAALSPVSTHSTAAGTSTSTSAKITSSGATTSALLRAPSAHEVSVPP